LIDIFLQNINQVIYIENFKIKLKMSKLKNRSVSTLDTETMDTKPPTIAPVNKLNDSDFPSMGVDLMKRVNFKIAFFLLLLGVTIFSDLFIENFLPDTYRNDNCTNTTGTFAQLIIFILGYIVIDLLIQGGML